MYKLVRFCVGFQKLLFANFKLEYYYGYFSESLECLTANEFKRVPFLASLQYAVEDCITVKLSIVLLQQSGKLFFYTK